MINIDEYLTKLKVIVSEVDGIVTDGLITYDELGNVPFKTFNSQDLDIVNELKKTFKFIFLAKDQYINYNLFRRKNIPFYWAEKDKLDFITKILQRYEITLDEMLYVGFGRSDLPCINRVPFSVCPSNANKNIKSKVALCLNTPSGGGVLYEIYELLKSEIDRRHLC
jgi:YrbI family 3-deoxy-D-manno-octulosonate 8-phosphate phosphatase